MNTLSLVDQTIEIRDEQESTGIKFDQVWCVFDLDDFQKENFDQAIERAKKEKFHVAYSNEAFELWFVLHFDYLQSNLNRQQYIDKLNTEHIKPYSKTDESIYAKLIRDQKMQDTAIRHAQKLLDEHHPAHLNPSAKTPSTTVHLLVLELNKHIRKS